MAQEEPTNESWLTEEYWSRDKALARLRDINGDPDKIKQWNEQWEDYLDTIRDSNYRIDSSKIPVWSSKNEPANLQEINLHCYDEDNAEHLRINLSHTHFNNADLSWAYLENADLSWAYFENANLSRARLENAYLNGARLENANLRGARLKEAKVHGANLNGADLRDVYGLQFDDNDIHNAKFSPRSSDAWSIVRRNYTGPAMAYNLLFLIAFLTPYVARSFLWTTVHRIEGLTKQFPIVEDDAWPMWQLLIGWDKGATYAATAIVLILYNIIRPILTWWLSQVRDAEERSNRVPAKKLYLWAYWLHHYFLRYVFWFAVISFFWHTIPWLFVLVQKPAILQAATGIAS